MIDHSSEVPMWYSATKSGLILDANDAALRFWGYERKQFVGMPAIRLLAPEELPKQKKMSSRAVKGQTGPWKCLRGDGSLVYVVVRWTRTTLEDETVDVVAVHSWGEKAGSLDRAGQKKMPSLSAPSATRAHSLR